MPVAYVFVSTGVFTDILYRQDVEKTAGWKPALPVNYWNFYAVLLL